MGDGSGSSLGTVPQLLLQGSTSRPNMFLHQPHRSCLLRSCWHSLNEVCMNAAITACERAGVWDMALALLVQMVDQAVAGFCRRLVRCPYNLMNRTLSRTSDQTASAIVQPSVPALAQHTGKHPDALRRTDLYRVPSCFPRPLLFSIRAWLHLIYDRSLSATWPWGTHPTFSDLARSIYGLADVLRFRVAVFPVLCLKATL